jgi:16S rRNA (uracil1498-N3)-methyltransferase
MRFYVSPEFIFPEKKIIELRDKKEVHHIRDVMRLKKGAGVTVFDGRGRECLGNIKDVQRDLVVINISEIINSKLGTAFNITLYQALPKKGKMDFIVEKATELGVNIIVPILTDRTVALIKETGKEKIDRWRRVAKAASKQCRRPNFPLISDAMDFNTAVLKSKDSGLVLFAALDKDAEPLASVLKDIKPKDISVFVGPEGDFSEQEISLAKKEGYRICSLGQLVLRVDTAVIYILSCLNYEYKN